MVFTKWEMLVYLKYSISSIGAGMLQDHCINQVFSSTRWASEIARWSLGLTANAFTSSHLSFLPPFSFCRQGLRYLKVGPKQLIILLPYAVYVLLAIKPRAWLAGQACCRLSYISSLLANFLVPLNSHQISYDFVS